jgi:hypothetical protein
MERRNEALLMGRPHPNGWTCARGHWVPPGVTHCTNCRWRTERDVCDCGGLKWKTSVRCRDCDTDRKRGIACGF